MSRRGTSTVVIHLDGTVTYWSTDRRVMATSLPENITGTDLAKLSKTDYDRLKARFGLTKAGSGWRLSSAAEQR